MDISVLSLSARRAWIEIQVCILNLQRAASLSARRAWIEITIQKNMDISVLVALRKESVDRNNAVQIVVVIVYGRSPQGERG